MHSYEKPCLARWKFLQDSWVTTKITKSFCLVSFSLCEAFVLQGTTVLFIFLAYSVAIIFVSLSVTNRPCLSVVRLHCYSMSLKASWMLGACQGFKLLCVQSVKMIKWVWKTQLRNENAFKTEAWIIIIIIVISKQLAGSTTSKVTEQ